MKEYLLLLRGGDVNVEHSTEEEVQQHMGRWMEFMSRLSRNGFLIGGLPLQSEGRVMSKDYVKQDIYGGIDAVGGYLLLKANSYEHVVDLAEDCPVFDYNGTIEIREIMPMNSK